MSDEQQTNPNKTFELAPDDVALVLSLRDGGMNITVHENLLGEEGNILVPLSLGIVSKLQKDVDGFVQEGINSVQQVAGEKTN